MKVYLGDLQEVMKRVVKNKTEGGLFCFSVELMAEEGARRAGGARGGTCAATLADSRTSAATSSRWLRTPGCGWSGARTP